MELLLYEAYFPVIVPNGRTTLLGREGWEFESLLPDLEIILQIMGTWCRLVGTYV